MIDEAQVTSDPLSSDLSSAQVKRRSVGSNPVVFALPVGLARGVWRHIAWHKVLLFAISLFLFILAITLMKEGARGLGVVVDELFSVSNAFNSLGFGWLFAYLVMSGSPVAASALTFFDAGIIDKIGAFTMITGSRLGANFIVLFIGFIYALRGRSRAESLSLGLLSLSVTGSTYLIALGIGCPLLQSGLLDGIQLSSGAVLTSATDLLFDPLASLLLTLLPQWALFLVGLAVILGSFGLFDRCLPQAALQESQLGRMSRLIYRRWVMFLLGGLVTLVSMSVTVSLGLLVPFSVRGFVRRENLIPYVMGANITTFVDTLLAAVLLRNPAAFTIVLVEMVSIALVSMVILITVYRWYERGILAIVGKLSDESRSLAVFMVVIFALPLILMWL